MATDVVLIQFLSIKEVNEALERMRNQSPSLSIAIDRWMEVLASLAKPRWLKISGVPMHTWREGIFRLIGKCVGSTLEVDPRTSSKEIITHGRVKEMFGKISKLSRKVPL